MFSNLFFNYYTIAALLSTIMVWVLSYFLLSLKKKSAPTWIFGLVFLLMGFFNVAQLYAYSVVSVSSAYHRIFTVFFVLAALSLFSMFAHYYGGLLFKKEARIYSRLVIALIIINTAYFIYEITQKTSFYTFNGHYSTFNAGVVTARFIQFLFIYFIVTGIRKALRLEGSEKKAMFLFVLVIAIALGPASITNRLSIDGKISRDVHQIVFSTIVIIGYFSILILYINHTVDNTTFMFKIVGISMLAILLIVQAISMAMLPYINDSFHEKKIEQAKRAIEDNRINSSIQYVITMSSDEPNTYVHKKENVNIKAQLFSPGKLTCRVQEMNKAHAQNKKRLYLETSQRTGADFAYGPFKRIWRCGKKQGNFYVAYQLRHAQKTWEVGFPYLSFRAYIHEVARWFVVISVALTFFIMIIFPLFFNISLVRPLNELLSGVEKVNNNDFDVHIPVKVNDEIGILSASFNSMVKTITEARDKLQDYANNLEEKVKERTKELYDKMQEIEALKVQQDGDYFLTSLISEPLAKNWNKSNLVKTTFYMEQKKKFSFKEKENELGGDICLTANLLFGAARDRYVLFANGDAMGKSMQGAGGAIVMGTSLNNIISRSAKNGRVIMSQTPAEWLESTYDELHNIFTTFDGSMMISIVLGLINEKTGQVFYFNAEHPWTILYRDGKASFIENELVLRKIGSFTEFSFSSQTFKLEDGDVLIAGSDGRDDILLGYRDNKERIINEDETQILRIIEESKADLELCVENIHNKGGLTDDLSLLKVEFQVPTEASAELNESERKFKQAYLNYEKGLSLKTISLLKEILESDPENVEAMRLLAQTYYRLLKDYAKAAEHIEEYLKFCGDDGNFWFYLSVCYKQLRNWEKSRVACEEVSNLQPYRVANLINLADNYRLLGMREKALAVINSVLTKEPEREDALRIRDRINA